MASGRDSRRKKAKCWIDPVKKVRQEAQGYVPVVDLARGLGAEFIPDRQGGGTLVFRGRDGNLISIRKKAHHG